MATQERSQATQYDLLKDFGVEPGEAPPDRESLAPSPHWAIAVVRLGKPLSFSRRTNKSLGSVKEGAFTRNVAPLFIVDDVLRMEISSTKRGHTKNLSATLKYSGINYCDEDQLLPDDWVFAWITNNKEDLDDVLARAARFDPCNEFGDGLKFVGRVHQVRQQVRYAANGDAAVGYQLQCIGFDELDTQFFYDMALATAANVSSNIRQFMAQIGLDFTQWADQNAAKAGNIKNNADRLIVSLINIILGKGISSEVNKPTERATAGVAPFRNGNRQVNPADLKIAPQANKEAPFAYLVPRAVGLLLGRDSGLASKGDGLFGYADILETLVGVQKYEAQPEADQYSMYPEIDLNRSTASRKFTQEPLKGTFLPVNSSFVNKPLWQILQQFLNPAINEMYTALKANRVGRIIPTLVVRQIPFSSESMTEEKDFALTKFMSLPRWQLDPVMVSTMDQGRSNATRTNMVHIYGEASNYATNKSLTHQLTRNPPIFDETDIQRSGTHGRMMMVNCAVTDQLEAPRAWMEAIADWSFGSQYTLNGTIDSIGIQSPIAEGDNVEYEDVVYHIESVTHSVAMNGANRTFRTVLEVSNGMPADQSDATADAPRYPGFHNIAIEQTEAQDETTEATGDENFFVGPPPGTSLDTVFTKTRRGK